MTDITKNPLLEKSEKFADRIVNMHHYLNTVMKEYVISNQIIRSGTSIGANISEANFSGSKKDFISKMNIAAKERSETSYWLNRLKSAKLIADKQFESMHADCSEIGKLLTSSIKTARKNLNAKQIID